MIALGLLVQERPLSVITSRYSSIWLLVPSLSYNPLATHADRGTCPSVLVNSDVRVDTPYYTPKCHGANALRRGNNISFFSLSCGFRKLQLKIVAMCPVRIEKHLSLVPGRLVLRMVLRDSLEVELSTILLEFVSIER